MNDKRLHLIMPMGGEGSRFVKNGYSEPKPLIEINNRPFLYWAAESVVKYIVNIDITFVVLKKHIDKYDIDKVIKQYYPKADIIVIPEVLPGAVLTCMAGLEKINDNIPIIFNDCDHIFKCEKFNKCINNGLIDFDGGLLTFKSDKPQFSYIKYKEGKIEGTVEKEVASSDAICGAYIFRNKKIFENSVKEYLKKCQYSEYYVSGVYNVMCEKGLSIRNFSVDYHVPFGTPDEYKEAKLSKYFDDLM